MSAKWRALQRRHQWTYDSVILPPAYIESLHSLSPPIAKLKFIDELCKLSALTSIHSQVTEFKKVVAAFSELVVKSNTDEYLRAAMPLYLEILFVENSLPLHRSLLSAFSQNFPINHQSLVKDCFEHLCKEYGLTGKKCRRFGLARVATSILSLPKSGFFKEVTERCSTIISLHLCNGLQSVLKEANEGVYPSPATMEQCQDGMSSVYYLLQQFPHKFAPQVIHDDCISFSNSHHEGQTIYEIVVSTILDVLKSSVFSRDCMLAAGVSFCAAGQIISEPQLALLVSNAIFEQLDIKFAVVTSDLGIIETCDGGCLEAVVMKLYNRNLASQVKLFTDFGRLCLLRGMLTAIPRSVLNTNLLLFEKDTIKGSNTEDQRVWSLWTILFDGILPFLCNLCESSVDSHFNFHAVTALQICLQQTVKQAQVVFELLIDVQLHLTKNLKKKSVEINAKAELKEGNDVSREFLHRITSELLLVGGHRKGRYMPLSILTQRLGATNLLNMSPNLLFETVQAYVDDDVCCSATSFLKCFLERLREDCWSSESEIEEGYRAFRRLWIPPIISGLVSGSVRLRSNLNTYALPVALQIDVDGIFPMLGFIFNSETVTNDILSWHELDGAVGLPGALTINQNVAASISLLKVARLLALVEGDIDWYHHPSELADNNNGLAQESLGSLAVVHIKGLEVHVPVEWLKLALTHIDESLRIDAAELLFLNPKTSSLVSTLELNLMRIAIPLNMRCSSTGFRMKWTSLFKKYFSRVRTAIERKMKQAAHQTHVSSSCCESHKGQGIGCSLMTNCSKNENKSILESGVKELDQFMKWLSRLLVFSLYPSAPYERKSMAMELFLVMIDIWHVNQPLKQENGHFALSSSQETCHYSPYDEGLLLADSTLVVVGAIVDSWDKLRENAFQILLQFPTPLPGISNKMAVHEIILWAKSLVSSPRVRESDAGALILRLIFKKYVLDLGWIVKIAENYVSDCQLFGCNSHCNSVTETKKINSRDYNIGTPVGEYILSLVDWLNMGIEEGEKDLVKACEHSFIHGILLALRYTIEELDWTSASTQASASLLQLAIEKLLGLVVRVSALALWVVSSNALSVPENIESLIEDLHSRSQSLPDDVEEKESVNAMQEQDAEDNDAEAIEAVGPVDQVVMVGCWLAMKEVSLLLGTLTRKVPLPGCISGFDRFQDRRETGKLIDNSQQIGSFSATLDVKQLEIIGEHFLKVLLAMKHNGAIDKTRAGFTALCNRLLCSSDPRLNQMPETWMKQLMERTIAKGQTVDDLLRRSAGIPAAFIAFFLSEPEGTPKKLLPSAMRWLIDLAKSFLSKSGNLCRSCVSNCDPPRLDEEDKSWSTESVPLLPQPDIRHMVAEESQNFSKQRDEGVVPTVHAFNALKVAFHDKNLSTDTSGFCAEVLIIAICSFSSHYWEVRNSATLAFTALVHRMIGFLNDHKQESARRAMTGFEFFHRYPTLHPFLLKELHNATKQLEEGVSQNWRYNKLGKSLHPSLVPVLIILSRLKPSIISSGTEDWLNPSVFMPYIRRCATQCNLRVRILASKALVPLVSGENLLNILLDIASGLPKADIQMGHRELGNSGPRTTLNFDNVPPLNRQSISFNSIHGILLQIDSLLSNNCMIIPDVVKKDEIVNALLPALESCSGLGSNKLCSCPMVTAVYLQVLEDLLKIAGTCPASSHIKKIQSMLIYFSSECLDVSGVLQSDIYDSTRIDLRQQAVALYFNTMMMKHPILCAEGSGADTSMHSLIPNSLPSCYNFESSNLASRYEDSSSFLERLKGCLSDSTYEVRLISLKMLYQFIKSLESKTVNEGFGTFVDSIHQWLQANLQATLLERLELETNPKCLRHTLQVLFVCYQNNLCWMDHQAVLDFWSKLVKIQGTARHEKIEETLILCLGVCIKQVSKYVKSSLVSEILLSEVKNHAEQCEKSDQWRKTYECICSWSVIMKKYSDPCESVNMRNATAEGIVASGLLEEVSWIGSRISNKRPPLQTSFSMTTYEESIDQLERLDLFARTILDAWFTCIKLLEDEDINLRQRLAVAVVRSMSSAPCSYSNVKNIVPAQVERVLELCFDFLTLSFTHWPVYFYCLANWVLGSEDHIIGMKKSGDMVRRLFDKELDNHHEERLLTSQLCCLHLQRLLNDQVLESDLQGTKIICPTMVETTHVNSREEMHLSIHKWRMKYLSKIISFVKHCIALECSMSWVGGIGNHQDVFKVIYPCLLGLYTFACHPHGKEHHNSSQNNCQRELLCSFTELTELMIPLLSNPLILNLYIKMLQAYENQLTINLGSKDLQDLKSGSWCQDFDPYFLIK
ncbi:uncharacterized protein LOC131039444 isoform X2 [Cryptomeria japonica]|uniref:uncharacterized protein LOC131039444 isoform X2 n=1 Tax=Cryptomeria japonica TaxID=3369 RepID=UPI0027DA6A4E|nr:uncharacterized protein LOC131039444 isoform X2 [Cryptomeria japonica]